MSGNVALGLLMTGALLVAIECNRPGAIVPGAVGLLLLLLGVNRLRVLPGWHGGPFWLALAGLGLIAVVRWRSLHGVPGGVGTILLSTALVQLARRSGGGLGMLPAGCCGGVLGGGGTWLMVVAGQAWRAKSGQRGALSESTQSGVAERWGVD